MANETVKAELTATEAALQMGLSRERVIRFVQTGKLPGRRDPVEGWRVDRKAVEAARRTVAA